MVYSFLGWINTSMRSLVMRSAVKKSGRFYESTFRSMVPENQFESHAFFSPFISNMFKLHIMLIKCFLLLFNALSRPRILLINMFELSILIRSKLFIIQFFKSASYYICYINISRKNTQCFSETSQRSKILRRMKSFLYFLRK